MPARPSSAPPSRASSELPEQTQCTEQRCWQVRIRSPSVVLLRDCVHREEAPCATATDARCRHASDGAARYVGAATSRRASRSARRGWRRSPARAGDGGRGRVADRRGQVPVLDAGLPRRADARHAALRARARRRLQRRQPAAGHGRAGRRRAGPLSDRRRPAARARVPRSRAARRLLPRLQRLEGGVLSAPRPSGLRWAAMLPMQDVELRDRRGAPRRRQRRGGVLRAAQPDARAATSTIATTFRSGPRSKRSTGRSPSTTRARRICRRTASAWTRTPPATSSRTRSRR